VRKSPHSTAINPFESDGSAVFHGGAKKVIRWQKRFMDHRVRNENEEDHLQHLEYIRLNPSGSAAFLCQLKTKNSKLKTPYLPRRRIGATI
jgi:hypothetical protein